MPYEGTSRTFLHLMLHSGFSAFHSSSGFPETSQALSHPRPHSRPPEPARWGRVGACKGNAHICPQEHRQVVYAIAHGSNGPGQRVEDGGLVQEGINSRHIPPLHPGNRGKAMPLQPQLPNQGAIQTSRFPVAR